MYSSFWLYLVIAAIALNIGVILAFAAVRTLQGRITPKGREVAKGALLLVFVCLVIAGIYYGYINYRTVRPWRYLGGWP